MSKHITNITHLADDILELVSEKLKPKRKNRIKLLHEVERHIPKYWPYCIHDRKCYESMIEYDAKRVARSYMDRFIQVRLDGYVYNGNYYTTNQLFNFSTGRCSGCTVSKPKDMKNMDYKLTRKNIMFACYVSDSSDDD
eukprot:SAG31_NODE_5289_length_2630_cov_2.574081_2_plen_139_part_00